MMKAQTDKRSLLRILFLVAHILASCRSNSFYDTHPAWSPTGTEIAFLSDRDGNFEIYLMSANGTNQQRLTHHPPFEGNMTWSPHGSRIAFFSFPENENQAEIYFIDADGPHRRILTQHPANEFDPSWSPDGEQIVFLSDRDGNREKEL